MNSNPILSVGCLNRIINGKEVRQKNDIESSAPIVQIIASKALTTGSIRCILFDGVETCKQAVLKINEQIQSFYDNKLLENFSVISLEEYWISTLSPNDVSLLVISQIKALKKGSEINRRLEAVSQMDISMDTFDTLDTFTDISLRNSFNPNYRPRNNLSNNEKTITTIDRSKICEIADLTQFYTSFVIYVRIAVKSPIKEFDHKNSKKIDKKGKLFTFDAIDRSSQIRIVAFNDECDKYFDFIEKDLLYLIYKGKVKPADKRYSNLKSEFEISLTSDSIVELCEEPVNGIILPSIQFKFVPIGELSAQNNGSSVDVIGIITNVEELKQVKSKKDQKLLQKREVLLIDKTLYEVRITLWGEEANIFNGIKGQVLAVKNAIVGDFRGKTLSCVQNSILELDPDFSDSHVLKGWYEKENTRLGTIISLCKSNPIDDKQLKYLSQINLQSIPEGSVLYSNCKATILSTVRAERHLYKSCPKKNCQKKVKEENDFYFCEKCGTNSTDFEWRLMLTLCCADSTADIWVTAFQEVAEKLIGKTTAQLSEMLESDPNEYQSLISCLHFKSFIFKITSRVEEYNNEKRIKSICQSFIPIDAIERSQKLINIIKSFPK